MVIQKRKRLQHTVTKTQILTTENVKTQKCLKKTKWPCKKDCNIWITVLKIQILTIENVRTKKRLKNIRDKMVS